MDEVIGCVRFKAAILRLRLAELRNKTAEMLIHEDEPATTSLLGPRCCVQNGRTTGVGRAPSEASKGSDGEANIAEANVTPNPLNQEYQINTHSSDAV